MNNQEIIQAVETAADKKLLVADLLSMDANTDDTLRGIDELTHTNVLRVIKDKELKRLVIRPSGKVEFNLNQRPGASKEQMEAFRKMSFEFDRAFVVNFANQKKFEFRVVKLAGKSFADVYTVDGKQAGFIKYLTSTIHPWFEDFGETHHVLGFTTIGVGKQVIDRESQLSYWINKDFYGEVFAKLHKEHQFQMKSMQALVKLTINKMHPVQRDEEGKKIRRKSLRIRISSLGLSEYNRKTIDTEVEIGGTKYRMVKTVPEDGETTSTLFLMTGSDKVIASAYFRPFRGSGNFFESNVTVQQENIGELSPVAIIENITKVMEEASRPNLGNAFAAL